LDGQLGSVRDHGLGPFHSSFFLWVGFWIPPFLFCLALAAYILPSQLSSISFPSPKPFLSILILSTLQNTCLFVNIVYFSERTIPRCSCTIDVVPLLTVLLYHRIFVHRFTRLVPKDNRISLFDALEVHPFEEVELHRTTFKLDKRIFWEFLTYFRQT